MPGAAERSGPCRTSAKSWPRISSRCSSLDDGKELFDLRIQLGKFQLQNRFSGMQYHVHRSDQWPQSPAHGRPHTTPNAAALHCSAQHLAHLKAYSSACLVAAITVKDGNITRTMLSALLVNSLKVCMLQKS